MCGIVGIFDTKNKREIDRALLDRMNETQHHRGPDEGGLHTEPGVGLGHRRLSIIDLSSGQQPLFNEDGSVVVAYNGEIYNFRELAAELAALGHIFRTHCDTEVIVHAYEEWGERSVERLRGMFAFAIVEVPKGPGGPAARVFLARDRLGIKPLYYALADGALFFASEVRALLASGCIPARLSPEAVPAYLLFGSVCEPATLVDGVNSLLPGHSMSIPCRAPVSSPEAVAYWDFGSEAGRGAAADRISHKEAAFPVKQVRSLLEDAVASHLVADVPVGVFLSSGVDSTAIAALASRAQTGIHTFTVAFPDLDFSEAEMARRTARRLGTEHRELTLSDQEMLARLDEAIAAFDQPSMDGINTYFVSWAARQAGLKVALSGLGSDELFGGYRSFRATSTVARVARLSPIVPQALRAFVADAIPGAIAFRFPPDPLRKVLAACSDPESLPHPYFFTRLLFTPRTVASRLRGSSRPWDAQPWWRWLAGSARPARSMDEFTKVSWLELRSYLVNTLLRDTDAMSMRHSLEVRVPFLDAPLVEYVLSLPESVKSGPSRPKALLVAALRDLLPDEVMAQRKRTFTFPWERWLQGPLGRRVAEGLTDWSPALEPHLDGGFALAVWKDYLRGRTTWSRPWSLYVLNEWVKRNLRADDAGAAEHRSAAAVSLA